jgi:hypothetical protein
LKIFALLMNIPKVDAPGQTWSIQGAHAAFMVELIGMYPQPVKVGLEGGIPRRDRPAGPFSS